MDAEGRILGLEDEFFHDQGAYIRTHGARVMDRTLWSIPGPYRVPAYRGNRSFPADQQNSCRDLPGAGWL